jgi:Mn-dependent DtxR family transcriptional regulator
MIFRHLFKKEISKYGKIATILQVSPPVMTHSVNELNYSRREQNGKRGKISDKR